MMGNMLKIEFSGIPEGATLAAMVTNNPDPEVHRFDRHGGLPTLWWVG